MIWPVASLNATQRFSRYRSISGSPTDIANVPRLTLIDLSSLSIDALREDHYEEALKDLLRKKQKGEKIERPTEPSRSNVVNLMDALRQSVRAETSRGGERKHARSAAENHASKKTSRGKTRHKKAS